MTISSFSVLMTMVVGAVDTMVACGSRTEGVVVHEGTEVVRTGDGRQDNNGFWMTIFWVVALYTRNNLPAEPVT